MIHIEKRKQKMSCGGALRHPRLIFCNFLLILLISCNSARRAITLALLGDLSIGRGVHPTSASLSTLAPELQAADLSLANLESPLAELAPPSGTGGGYNLCAPAKRAGLLSIWGLDLLSLANNHRFDCGPDGPIETARLLTSLGIAPIGPGPEPLQREIHGLKLAFLAFDDVSSPLDGAAAAQAIQSARKQGAVVVVSVHWGAEYQAGASDRQKALAEQLAQAGAALIVGTHPHVLQPAEWIPTPLGKTLVLYSLGNALFDQPGLPDTRQSALVVVRLDAQGVQSVRLVPFEIDLVHSRIVQPAAAMAEKIRERLQLP
jgi:poly-gamma-glutamate capsule biosynthesis protein CapA/YwtB (metallophosphatase superfamily)